VTPPPQYGPPAAAPGNDRVTLFGVLAIVFGICFWPVGLVFSILGYREAQRYGKSAVLAIIGFVLTALSLVSSIIIAVNR
jgi:hypothetical protein